jgi:N-acetylglucosamine-6-sulfatase
MKVIKILLALVFIISATSCAPVIPLAPRPVHPNIIFILTDDMAATDLPYMPRTIKLIKNQGITFDKFFVSISLCCPSRTSILRGQYAQNTKITDNALPGGGFEKVYARGLEQSMLPVWLKQAGYRTALFGKYLNEYPGTAGQTYIPPGWDVWASPVDGYPYTEFNYTLNENGKLVKYGNTPQDYGTDVYASKALAFIKDSISHNQTFFAYIAPYAPHHPFTPAPRHAGMYSTLSLPQPPSFNEADMRDKLKTFLWKPPLTSNQINELQNDYRLRIASLQAVDEMVGNIVDTLSAAGKLNDTYIFFSSDNGFHLGQHRLPAGKNTPYEEDILVPLLVSGPGIQPGSHVNELTGNIDIAPTIAELAGASAPSFIDGRSLIPFLFGQSVVHWRQAYLLQRALILPKGNGDNSDQESETFVPNGTLEPPDSSFDSVPLEYYGLRTQQYTYLEFTKGVVQIYDLKKDPYELNNFAATADPALLEKLHSWLAKLKNCTSDSCRSAEINQ